jgi:hypothetical protein
VWRNWICFPHLIELIVRVNLSAFSGQSIDSSNEDEDEDPPFASELMWWKNRKQRLSSLGRIPKNSPKLGEKQKKLLDTIENCLQQVAALEYRWMERKRVAKESRPQVDPRVVERLETENPGLHPQEEPVIINIGEVHCTVK